MATTSNPGKGYIILKPGTVIEDGDEYYCQGPTWTPTADQGRIIKYSYDLTYRRKKVVKSRPNISTLTADNTRLLAENKKLQDQLSNILDILKVTYNKYYKDNRR